MKKNKENKKAKATPSKVEPRPCTQQHQKINYGAIGIFNFTIAPEKRKGEVK